MSERDPVPSEPAPVFRLPRRWSVRRLAGRLAEVGYAVESVRTVRGEDVYLDTQDGALHRAGVRLRRRRTPPSWHLLERGWLAVQAPAAGEEAPADGELAAALAGLAGARRLLPQASVRTTGRLLLLRSPVGAEVELLVARWWFAPAAGGAAVPGPRAAALETVPAVPAEAQHLGAVLRDLVGLRRLVGDPLAAALAALDLPLPGAPVPEELRLAGADTMATAAHKILARQAYKMWANAAGTIADRDTEFLHDLRVATRRARSALRLLVPLHGGERCDALRAELGWIAERLGAVRDLDVHLERLRDDLVRAGAAPAADAGFGDVLRARRGPALAELRAALRSRRFESLVRSLRESAPAAGGTPEQAAVAATPAVAVAPDLIARAARRVRRWGAQIGAGATEPELHRLRILFKRLRYTCEFFADLYGEEFRAATARLVPFQDCLGALQDAVVAQGVLAEHAGALVAARHPAADDMLVLGALMQVQREVVARQRRELGRLWDALPKTLKALAVPLPESGSDPAAPPAPEVLSVARRQPGAAAARRPGARRTPPPR